MRKSAQLTAQAVRHARHPGGFQRPHRIGDGGGLYLQLTPVGGKSWFFRYRLNGRDREMGLGSASHDGRSGGTTLAEARDKAAEARRLLATGQDPLDARQSQKQQQKAEAEAAAREAAPRSFRDAAEAYLLSRSDGWSNPKHRQQWENTLRGLAYPHLGPLALQHVTTEDVLKVLEPLWQRVPETASRLRGRIEAVLDYAGVRGWRAGDNPARWRGHLSEVLAPKERVRRTEHRPALPWRQVPAFVAALRQREGVAAQALLFTILTAARTGEVRLARWSEVDLANGVWSVPAARMKARRLHRVPLPPEALAVLHAVAPLRRDDGLIFPAPSREGAALSDMSISAVIRRMNEEAGGDLPFWRDAEGRPAVPHGFRSSFRDWAGETRSEPREVIEAALAHTVKDKVEAAYARSDLLNKREPLMAAWATWCLGGTDTSDAP
ncbi:integrase arm-type DNA-binding domain-containing protein [Acetobacteraceae bacterium H6797]|nr:integrase arm-type DNA-binding domain-containing protein [Acetobacteraceae bacterium H6797]